jgi:hypothetical protein
MDFCKKNFDCKWGAAGSPQSKNCCFIAGELLPPNLDGLQNAAVRNRGCRGEHARQTPSLLGGLDN